jgi:two-component system response regulator NreC
LGVASVAVAVGSLSPIVERGLVAILGEDPAISVLGTNLDATSFASLAHGQGLHVAILHESSVEGPSTVAALVELLPHVGVLVLAVSPTQAGGLRFLGAGASCLSLASSPASIRDAVHATANGRRIFAPADQLLLERTVPRSAKPLSPREIEVLEYLAKGKSYDETALALGVAKETVRTHSAHIREKLGVRRKRDLIGIRIDQAPVR